MIELNNIKKVYKNKSVVDDVSVQLPKGELISIIGPNGAGKSTLLNIATRLIERDGGDVVIESTPLEQWKPKDLAKKMAVLKQSNHTNVAITVRELIEFGRYPHSQGRLTEKDHEMVDQVIEYMELDELQNNFLENLSGGQAQRAYIASILAQDSDYIFLDEPLNNLDVKYAIDMMCLLQKLVKELGKTVVIVIHDINFAATYSDHIIVLKNGALAKQGTVAEVITPEVLNSIYNVDFVVQNINGKTVCIY